MRNSQLADALEPCFEVTVLDRRYLALSASLTSELLLAVIARLQLPVLITVTRVCAASLVWTTHRCWVKFDPALAGVELVQRARRNGISDCPAPAPPCCCAR